MNKVYGGRIENWSELCGSVWGNLYDDPNKRFQDGTDIRTSRIVYLDYENNKLETLNTIYDLGKQLTIDSE